MSGMPSGHYHIPVSDTHSRISGVGDNKIIINNLRYFGAYSSGISYRGVV